MSLSWRFSLSSRNLWPFSYPGLPPSSSIFKTVEGLLEMQLQGIRQGFGCQGMTHNNALKTRWMRSRSSQIDSIFLRVCALGFPSPLGLPNLKMHASKLLPAASYCYWICHSWRPRQFMKMSLSCFYFCFVSGLRSGPSTADAGPTTTTPTSTTSMRGTPSSTRRRSVSMANTQQRSSKTWRGAQRCRASGHFRASLFIFSFLLKVSVFMSENAVLPGFWADICKKILFYLYSMKSLSLNSYFLINHFQLSHYLAHLCFFFFFLWLLLCVVSWRERFWAWEWTVSSPLNLFGGMFSTECQPTGFQRRCTKRTGHGATVG